MTMNFLELARTRYSCKKYDPDAPVENDKLADVLEAGRLAPTAKNLQEQHVYVVKSAEGLAKVDSFTPCRYGAPVVLVIAYKADEMFTYPGGVATSGVEDATIVTTHMLLAAAAIGLDSCWLNNFDPAIAKQALGLPDNEEVVALLDLGHAAETTKPLPNHGRRKDLSETVSYL